MELLFTGSNHRLLPLGVLYRLCGVGLGLFLWIGVGCTAGAQSPVLYAANGHYYEAVYIDQLGHPQPIDQPGQPQPIDWKTACESAKNTLSHDKALHGARGHLATITTPEELIFLKLHFSKAFANNYWIGGYQDIHAYDYDPNDPETGWRWITGKSFIGNSHGFPPPPAVVPAGATPPPAVVPAGATPLPAVAPALGGHLRLTPDAWERVDPAAVEHGYIVEYNVAPTADTHKLPMDYSALKTEKGVPVIVYDTNPDTGVGSFLKPFPKLDYHRPVSIFITNPNSFRYKYTLKSTSTDTHANPNLVSPNLPLLSKPPTQGVGGNNADPKVIKADRDALASVPMGTADGTSAKEIVAAWDNFDKLAIAYSKSATTLSDLNTTIIRATQQGSTNAEIRDIALNSLKSYYPDASKHGLPVKSSGLPTKIERSDLDIWAGGTKQKFLFKGVYDYRVEDYQQFARFASTLPDLADANFTAQADNFQAAYTQWQSTYKKYTTTLKDPTNDPNGQADLDTLNADVEFRNANTPKLADVLTSLKEATYNFGQIIDPNLAPTVIVKTLDSVVGDTLNVELDTDINPVISAQSLAVVTTGANAIPSVAANPLSTANAPPPANGTVTAATTVVKTASATITHRPVLDFSAGLAATNLIARNYIAFQPTVGNTTKKIVALGSSDSVDLNAATLAHYYVTSPQDITAGFTLGVAGATNLRFLTGGSLIFGRENRFIFSAGIAFGQVSRLSGDALGQPLLSGGTTISTANAMRAGQFLALSYRFSF